MKKVLLAIMVCVLAVSVSGLAIAAEEKKSEGKSELTADDIKWIAKCIDDNKDQGQSAEVVKKYCECMNEKMDTDETQSVTQWEKSHPKERKECDEKSGWK